jgi:hypothetical protein
MLQGDTGWRISDNPQRHSNLRRRSVTGPSKSRIGSTDGTLSTTAERPMGGPIRPGLLDTHPRPKDGRDSLRPLVIEGRGRRTDVTATGDSQSPPTECHHYPRERSPDGDSDSTRIGLGVVRTARRSGTDTDLCAGRGMGGHQRRRCRRCPRKPPLVDEAAPGSVRKEVSTKLGV